MHILVTGGSGFIGSHLTERLLAENHSVCVVDDLSTGRLKNLDAVKNHPNLEIINSDLANVRLVRNQCRRADQVYHLAAAVGVALIAARPTETIHRNIYPTQLLLEALQEEKSFGRDVPLFLASTSEVYGKNPKPVWNENDDLVFGATTKPRWSYGASKAIDEFLALAGVRENGLSVVIGRFFNVVGPRQTGTYGMVLPRFVTAAMNNEPLIVHDDGQQQRCFAHVLDVIDAVVQLMASRQAYGRVYNIGSDQPVNILELAERVKQIVNPEASIVYQSYTEAYDADFEDIRRRVPDLGRLQATINYKPRRTLDSTIQDIWQANLAEKS